ncbi:MAG: DUF2142 domain-containing protein [Lachnospiraceae bacterium]|jgi:uncharacterized membrane protein|nr:DUF2142 domain-containing protein [Lachnospiraceae bacterium]
MKQEHNGTFPASKLAIHFLLLGILMLTLAGATECVLFQWSSLAYKEKPICFAAKEFANGKKAEISYEEDLAKLTDEEQNAILVQRENERLIAEYNGEVYQPEEDDTLVEKDGVFYRKVMRTILQLDLGHEYYIKKLSVGLALEEDGGYQVSLYQNGEKTGEGLFCSISSKIGFGIMNVGQKADAARIVLTTQQKPDAETLSVVFSNEFSFNFMRFFFLFLLFSVVAILLNTLILKKTRTYLSEKPEWVFAISAFCLGSLMIWGIGTNQVGFDEYAHAKTAYDLSFGATIETTEAAMQMKGNLLPYFNTPEERQMVEAYEQKMATKIAPDITHQSRMVRTETRVYYPMAAGFWLGRKLHLDFARTVALAKFGNLLAYIAVVWLAIRLAGQYRLFVVLLGLLPNNLFIATSITYDAVVTSFLLLASVLMLNEILEPHRKLRGGSVLLMLFSFEVGCLSKPIYIVMACMLLFFGRDKFENRIQEFIMKAAVLLMTGLMLYNIFHPTPVSGGDYALVSNLSYAGDPRNTGSSVTGQIGYILHNPYAYTILLLRSMAGMLTDYVTASVPFVGFAYLGFASGVVNWICILLAVLASLYTARETQYFSGENKGIFGRSAIGMKYVILNLIMCFGVTAIVWTSMYVSYTAVGADVIEGVQGRYFIPLFLPFFSCLFLRRDTEKKQTALGKIWNGIRPAAMYAVLTGSMIFLNLAMIWKLVILRLNV